MSSPSPWIVSSICGDCLTSDTGRAILNGAVGIATLRPSDKPERCILCGHVLAPANSDQDPYLN